MKVYTSLFVYYDDLQMFNRIRSVPDSPPRCAIKYNAGSRTMLSL